MAEEEKHSHLAYFKPLKFKGYKIHTKDKTEAL
jgi:hypothetical protein